MELRQVKALVLSVYQDEIARITYIKLLAEDSCQSVKISGNLAKFKHNHLLQPHILLDIELVKTRKNWILSEITNFYKIMEPENYADFQKLAAIQKLLNQSLSDGQETEILIQLVDFLQQRSLNSLSLIELEEFLLGRLGFLDMQNMYITTAQNIWKSKSGNHLTDQVR
jgi:hypothetical protein